MAIYTRFGKEVNFTAAKIIPMWSEYRNGEILHHYSRPESTKRTKKIEEMPTWHVTAIYAADGHALSDGKYTAAGNFVADDGIREIHDVMHALRPSWEDDWNRWNKVGGPDQTEVWGDNMGERVA